MPIYEFTCQECGLRFEKLFRRISDDKTSECPSCEGEGTRQVSAVSFKFSHPQSQLRGIAPSNTGTSDDWNYDRIIGRDAEKKWEKINENRSRKAEIIRDEAKQGRKVGMDHLVKKSEGGYRVMTEPERKTINERRKLTQTISKPTKKE